MHRATDFANGMSPEGAAKEPGVPAVSVLAGGGVITAFPQ
jgi:hypothetical protein